MAKEKQEKKPDYMDADWSGLIRDRLGKWERMWEEYAAEGKIPVPLWPEGKLPVPHTEGFAPRLLVYPAHEGEARGIFIVCAGGGFMFQSSNEAKPVADFFYAKGINVAVLDYNTDPARGMSLEGREVQEAAGADAARAIRTIRYHAKEWNIRPDKIAIGGFSAGGGVTGMAGTMFDYGNPEAEDPIERVSSRPDACLIIYSAFTADATCIGGENRRYSFAGQNEHLKNSKMCWEQNLRLDCPPFFVTQTCWDDPRGSLRLGLQLANRGIVSEVHTFEEGPHGGGLYNGQDEDSPHYPHTMLWAEVAADWLKVNREF